LKAPRLIARSFTFLRQVGRAEVDPRGSVSETDRDLTKTPKPVHHPNMEFPVTLQGLRVQPPAATVVDRVGTAPAGV
jgi:hypothetical protein